MTKRQGLGWRRALSSVLILALFAAVPLPPASAQTGAIARLRALIRGQQGIGQARSFRGAGVRDPDFCPPTERSLTALIPNPNEPIQTSAAHPTFWFYVPYAIAADPAAFTLKLVLQDQEHREIYQAAFPVPEAIEPGIISLRLTPETPALEVGQTYRWYFLIYCNDPQQIYEPAFVEGQIQREPLLPAAEPPIAQPASEQFLHYAEAGWWFDTLTALAAARQQNPLDRQLDQAWRAILQEFNLSAIQQAEIVAQYYVQAGAP